MTLDIHTKVTLSNWGFLAEIGEWQILKQAVDLYISQNPPQCQPASDSGTVIERMVLDFLKNGEIRGSELYFKLEGYSTQAQLQALESLVSTGRVIQTWTGFKLPS
jgi:hypothetical protein